MPMDCARTTGQTSAATGRNTGQSPGVRAHVVQAVWSTLGGEPTGQQIMETIKHSDAKCAL